MWGSITGIAKSPTITNITMLNKVDLFSTISLDLNTIKISLSEI